MVCSCLEVFVPRSNPDAWQTLFARLRAGEQAARDELIARTYERLRRLMGRMIQDYPIVEQAVTTSDVLHESFVRLRRALEAVPVNSMEQFFKLAALQMRRQLLEMARVLRRRPQVSSLQSAGDLDGSKSGCRLEPGQSTLDPAALQRWTEFHERVQTLPEEERVVFDLLFYHNLGQAEAAAILGVSIPTIKRRWISARLALAALFADTSL